MDLIFFESPSVNYLYPITLSRPADQIRVGILTLAEKWRYDLGVKLANQGRILRDELQGVFASNKMQQGQQLLFIDPLYFPSPSLVEEIKALEVGQAIFEPNAKESMPRMIAFKWSADQEGELKTLPEPKVSLETGSKPKKVQYPWDIFLHNAAEIGHDIQRLGLTQKEGDISIDANLSTSAILEGKENIWIQEGAKIEAGAMILAHDGPVYIGRGAKVLAGAMIRSNVAICDGSTVNMGAKIYENTTLGPVCKVGGELSNSVLHSYSNKGHDGFMGHSVIGQWCNLGADTNTSNLKNNYSTVRVAVGAEGQLIDSGQQFVGTIMGDHSKTAINTMLNTGTVVGMSANIAASGFPEKSIPSFSWLTHDSKDIFQLDKAIDVAAKVMNRRNQAITTSYARMMEAVFNATRKNFSTK